MAVVDVYPGLNAINNAIAAAAAGDSIHIHAGNYPENVVVNKQLQLVGADGHQEAIINPAAGDGVVVTAFGCWIENLRANGSGANIGFRPQGNACFINRCIAQCWLAGFYSETGTLSIHYTNCLAYDCTYGWYGAANRDVWCFHCTAVDNVTAGFAANVAGDLLPFACLAAENGTDYINGFAGTAWNVSSDLTAPGNQSRTGFLAANFINYAGDDFGLAFAGENGANIAGWPLSREDYLENTRERDTRIFYAGFHDPYVPPGLAPPECCGAIDAAPAAQGCILVRFCEMLCSEGTVPYRYEFHVKHVDLGPLTCDEIDAGTWYARSVYNDEVLYGGSPMPSGSPMPPGAILQALIAFEAWNQHGDNIHLFTNRQYYIAVRAVAIDADDRIYEDDNCEVVVSWSSGYQGIQWEHILSWPCLELCSGQKFDIGDIPPVETAITDIPNLDVGVRSGVGLEAALSQIGANLDRMIGQVLAGGQRQQGR
jgi:hypothetical protein